MTSMTGRRQTTTSRSMRRGYGGDYVGSWHRRQTARSEAIDGDSGKKERGYFRHRFEDAWARYTPSNVDPQNTRSTRSTTDNDRETKENTGPDTDADTRSNSDDTRSTEDGNGAGPGNGTDGPSTGPGKEDLPGPEKCQQDEELTGNGPDRPGISGDAESESPPAEDSFPNVRRPGNGADSDWEPL